MLLSLGLVPSQRPGPFTAPPPCRTLPRHAAASRSANAALTAAGYPPGSAERMAHWPHWSNVVRQCLSGPPGRSRRLARPHAGRGGRRCGIRPGCGATSRRRSPRTGRGSARRRGARVDRRAVAFTCMGWPRSEPSRAYQTSGRRSSRSPTSGAGSANCSSSPSTRPPAPDRKQSSTPRSNSPSRGPPRRSSRSPGATPPGSATTSRQAPASTCSRRRAGSQRPPPPQRSPATWWLRTSVNLQVEGVLWMPSMGAPPAVCWGLHLRLDS